jgi:hypothetical protein
MEFAWGSFTCMLYNYPEITVIWSLDMLIFYLTVECTAPYQILFVKKTSAIWEW